MSTTRTFVELLIWFSFGLTVGLFVAVVQALAVPVSVAVEEGDTLIILSGILYSPIWAPTIAYAVVTAVAAGAISITIEHAVGKSVWWTALPGAALMAVTMIATMAIAGVFGATGLVIWAEMAWLYFIVGGVPLAIGAVAAALRRRMGDAARTGLPVLRRQRG